MRPKSPNKLLPFVAAVVLSTQLLPGNVAKAETAVPATPTPDKPEACEVLEGAPAPVPIEASRGPTTPLPDFCSDIGDIPPTPAHAKAPEPRVGQAADVGADVPDLMVEDPNAGIAAIKAAEYNEALMREAKYLLPGQVTAIAEQNAVGAIFRTQLILLHLSPTEGAEETWGHFSRALPANILEHVEQVIIVGGDGPYNIYDRATHRWATATNKGEMETIVRDILSGVYDGWVPESNIHKKGPKVDYYYLTDSIINTMYIDPPPIKVESEGFHITMPPLAIILRLDNGQTVSYRTTPTFYMSKGIWYPTKELAASVRVGYPNVWVRYDFNASDEE